MNVMPTDPCAHPGCGCKVDSGQRYCSDYCREHGTHEAHAASCECGHSDCIVEEALRRGDPD